MKHRYFGYGEIVMNTDNMYKKCTKMFQMKICYQKSLLEVVFFALNIMHKWGAVDLKKVCHQYIIVHLDTVAKLTCLGCKFVFRLNMP